MFWQCLRFSGELIYKKLIVVFDWSNSKYVAKSDLKDKYEMQT